MRLLSKIRPNIRAVNLPVVDKNNEYYRNLYRHHTRNACFRYRCDKLIFEAIKYALQRKLYQRYWREDRAEAHPANRLLCQFWQVLSQAKKSFEACVPYIQLFLDEDNYYPLIGHQRLPVRIKVLALQQEVHEASVIFGEHFLVTYLAGREVSSHHPSGYDLVHYSVRGKPFLKVDTYHGSMNLAAQDIHNSLALQTLDALARFPKHFPTLWQGFVDQHEGRHYGIC